MGLRSKLKSGLTGLKKAAGGEQAISPKDLPLIDIASEPASFDRFIFICGLHRSGTTLLERHLRVRFRITALSSPVHESEGQHLQDVYPAGRLYGGPGRFAFAPEMRPARPQESDAAVARERLLACWTAWTTEKTDTLLEKSPPNLTKIPWLRAVFPGAQFIIMTRDPRVVAAATDKWSGTSNEELMFHWHVAHSIALEDEGPDCVRVRYEDFCADSEAEIARMQTTLGLEPKSGSEVKDERFGQLVNSNAKYLEGLPPRNYGSGAWDAFGYDVNAR